MIVKLRGSTKNSWCYYECDRLHIGHETSKELKGRWTDTDVLLNNKNVTNDKRDFKVLIMKRFKNDEEVLITDKPIYLLNNDGKTIDKI